MKTYTKDEIMKLVRMDPREFDKDNDGQLIIYTGVYEWSNGEYHDEPEGEDNAKG